MTLPDGTPPPEPDGPGTPPPGTPPPDTPPPEPAAAASPDSGDTDLTAQVAKWKELARKNEERAKANAAAAKRLQEIEDADKTELQRATDKVAELERERDDARAHLMRAEVAASKGLNAQQAKRLQGSTVEELERDADELLDAFKQEPQPNGSGSRNGPVPRLRSGAVPGAEPTEIDPRKLAESIPR